ncbi:AsmA-like C-terminal domain-containing protein [Halarcobacter ebronensis]|uniref:YhdP central domain-containing protein n=1 Tax=Halarcobacter ebronensis TaxID=1462615 RepID=A0A4Q1AT66_9BACT|nr:AsmA-like C-terminal domain-containing protein [Halarcobacter ebronensis]QKF82245.1 AsmA family protein (DUF3971 domain) [Halarcobacter ebronensis]RXK07721.1 hypothetical protein CRV07_04470 [Halarcobacter ebronensis]
MLKIVKAISLFFVLFFIISGISLFYGIKIDSFSFSNFTISKFYLKLDKKLILKTEKIVTNFKSSSEDNSLKGLYQKLSNLNILLKLFKEIDIKELKVNDSSISIHLDNSFLYLDNKFINIASDLKVEDHLIKMDIYSIYLKKEDLAFFGNIKVDLNEKVASFLGKYDYRDIKGEINAKFSKKYLDFYIDTANSIKSIGFLKEYFRLDSVAEEWMYDNVEGDIKLNYLYGKVDLKNYEPIINSIKGQAVIKNAKIRFNKAAKTVDTPTLTIDYENDKLSFNLENPIYNTSKIYGSNVYITDLTSMQKGTVFVDLKSDSILNSDVLEILKAYEINLPLIQTSGTLDSKLLLTIPYLASKEMHVDGEFKAINADFKLGNFDFFASTADVSLKDNDVYINNSYIKHKEMLSGNLKLKIDTKKEVAQGEIKIDELNIKSDNKEILFIKDKLSKIDIDFSDKTKIKLDDFKSDIEVKDDYLQIVVNDLNSLYDYSTLLKEIGLSKGDLTVDIYDENKIDFKVNAIGLNLPFKKENKKIENLTATGVLRNEAILIKTNDDSISIVLESNKTPIIKLKKVDLILSEGTGFESKEYPTVNIELRGSKIELDKEHIFNALWANLYLNKKVVEFEGEGLDLDLPISKNGKIVTNLQIRGVYKDNLVELKSKDKGLSLKYDIPKERIDLKLKAYDIVYNTNDEEKENIKTSYYVKGENSNIIINEKHIAKATNYSFVFEKKHTRIDLNNGATSFFYEKDRNDNITLSATNMTDNFLNPLIGKNLIKGGYVNVLAKGKDTYISGNAYFNETKIVDLAILNNLIILVNTSPAIINPFLAIPSVVGMATNGGFNLNGYRITEGKVEFSYSFVDKFLNMNKLNTEGNGIDFDGYTTIDFKTSAVDAKLKMIFFKDYSKLVNYIPVINYILLGDEKRVDTEVTIYGTLEEPKYKTNFIEEGVSAPVNFLKRVFTTPFDLIKSIGSSNKEEEEIPKSE